MRTMEKTFSIIIPCFNEEKQIGAVLDALVDHVKTRGYNTEIVVVNDGSTDATSSVLASRPVTVITHPHNRGYGASLKTGAAVAKYDWLLFYDADGQHSPELIDTLVAAVGENDMVVGARQGYQGPLVRQPGKWLIRKVAEYLSGHKIPDFNSGLRLVSKALFNEFRNLYPDGFSLSTTITIAALKNHYRVQYVPISIAKRGGKSTVRWNDAVTTLMLVSRLIVVFSPLKLFTTISSIMFVVGLLSLVNDLLQLNLNEATLFLIISALLIFLFGLLSDQIADLRRRL